MDNDFDDLDDSPRKRRKPKRFLSLFFVFLVVVAGFGMLYWMVKQIQENKEKEEVKKKEQIEKSKKDAKNDGSDETPSVHVYKVSKGKFMHTMETLGTILSKAKIDLRFEVNGVVEATNVEDNDEVREGDVIGELGHKDAELKISFRKSKWKEAKIEEKNWNVKVNQNKQLLEAGAITEDKYQESVLGLKRAKQAGKSAKIELQSAEAELDKTYLKCPIVGIVEKVKVHRGEFVTSQKVAFTVMEIEEVVCEFSVLEKDIQNVVGGQDITITVDTYPGEKFSGKITSMGAIVDKSEGRARKVKATITNDENKLLPGMFSRVNIILMQKDDAITVPTTAFANIEEDTSSVWVVDKENKVKRREISVEHFSLNEALIESGLKVGDQVVVDVTNVKLKDDQTVEIVEVREAKKEK